jgi:hypothetical protein
MSENLLIQVKIFFLIILSSLNFLSIGYLKADGFDINEFFESKKIHKKCMADENNRLIYGRNRNKYCNCYVDKYMNNSIPLIASLECHGEILEKIESLSS